MKVSITQENLHKSLSHTSRIVGSRNTLPVLGNVLLQTQDNRLKLAATNLEMGITCYIGAKVEVDGATTLPAKLLSEYVNNLPAGNIDIEIENNTAHLSAGGYESKINGIDAGEFPSIPEVKGDVSFTIAGDTLAKALEQVVGVCSGDDSRPVLTGVYLYTDNGVLYAVATDSYRLAEKRVAEVGVDFQVIVPGRSVSELLRLLGDSDVEVRVDEEQIGFVFNDIELVSRVIDGEFPDYRQLIPQEVPTQARVATNELKSVAKIAGLFAREDAGSVMVSIDEEAMHIRSIANQVGENTSQLEASVSGEPIEVSLNGRYINDALGVIDTEEVDVGLTGKVNPCLIRPVDDDSYLHLIMPLRS